MQTKTVTIRVQTLDGTWETIGVDRLRGVYPENDSYTADEWGSSKCSFDLHRDPGAIFPDLSAFTPIDVEIGGQLVWSGRVTETPIREGDRIFNVQGQGWQFHLDDDVFSWSYVHADLSDWKDQRTFPGTILTAYTTAYQMTADKLLNLMLPNGTVASTGTLGALTLDLGPGRTATTIEVAAKSGGNAGIRLMFRAGDTPDTGADEFLITSIPTTPTAATFNPTNPHRYWRLALFNNSGAPLNGGDDTWLQILSAQVFAINAYDSAVGADVLTGNSSLLTASTVVTDAIGRGTTLLSTDLTGIVASSFKFPEFALDGQRTPREVINAANAVEDRRAKIDVNRRIIFEAKPTSPRIEAGAWPGSVFDDASANSGDDIYNRAIVEGTGPDSSRVSFQRTQGQAAGATLETISTPAPGNPSFAVDASTWTPSSPSLITRNTTGGQFDTAPAGGRWDRAPTGTGIPVEVGDTLTETFTGTFKAGTLYVLNAWFGASGPMQGSGADITFGAAGDFVTGRWGDVGTPSVRQISWIPTVDHTSGVTLKIVTTARTTWLIDSLALFTSRPTLVDRRGFKRTHILPITNSLNQTLAERIGDVWLAAHRTTPLKGTAQIIGDKACRDITTGADTPPELLLTMTGDLLRLAHRVDPDTGGQGRDGRIAEVTYTPATDTATVAIDSRRTSHEALLERLAVVVGSR